MLYCSVTLVLSLVSQSRAALSLLGFCYYHIQDFTNSADCYEQLAQLHPEVEEYKVYYAQSLYKAGAYPEATRASFALDNPSSHVKVRPSSPPSGQHLSVSGSRCSTQALR